MAARSVQYDAEKKIWNGLSKEYPFGNLGMAEVIYNNLKNNPTHIAQVRIRIIFKV